MVMVILLLRKFNAWISLWKYIRSILMRGLYVFPGSSPALANPSLTQCTQTSRSSNINMYFVFVYIFGSIAILLKLRIHAYEKLLYKYRMILAFSVARSRAPSNARSWFIINRLIELIHCIKRSFQATLNSNSIFIPIHCHAGNQKANGRMSTGPIIFYLFVIEPKASNYIINQGGRRTHTCTGTQTSVTHKIFNSMPRKGKSKSKEAKSWRRRRQKIRTQRETKEAKSADANLNGFFAGPAQFSVSKWPMLFFRWEAEQSRTQDSIKCMHYQHWRTHVVYNSPMLCVCLILHLCVGASVCARFDYYTRKSMSCVLLE